ncbi:hypothetical protein PV396_24615 [Streptomyces sp. ME02-8801-2C]|uniref:hypothetical protein n=1 Tax=Streptomyces sp. ME02-8801-2C TaxID=3028680 RepID=UPI0029ABFE6D|nr:hypothetical protein [Streptomyces sp. ME02-8801-2C]MDX3455086.1 hypothetical protein [Streptomyces sp. ME02-8801-2C]
MPSETGVVLCDTCQARIRWAITAHGRRQPLNADPDPKGNLGAYVDGTGTLRVRVLTKERDRLEGMEWQAMPHIATCTAPPLRVPAPARRPNRRRAAVRPGAWRWGR